MNLEQRIKELEKKLALKKAYDTVKVSFGRGNSIPDEVKKEVEESIKTFCEMMSERIDREEAEAKQTTSNKQKVQKAVSNNLKDVRESAEKVQNEKPLTATLMTTDSLSQEMKQLVSSMTEVQIVGLNETHASIKVETKKGLKRAAVPKEDLQINEPQEEEKT